MTGGTDKSARPTRTDPGNTTNKGDRRYGKGVDKYVE